MSGDALKDDLHRNLRDARAVLLWKLDGLSEYQARQPMTPHGTNLLGLVKHLTGCEMGYFGYVFNRPFLDPPPWLTQPAEPMGDMWATADESRHDITQLYRRACAHSDTTIESLELQHRGMVPTWPPGRRSVTLHQILVHMLAETSRHAGHADIVRELVDGDAGLHPDRRGLPDCDAECWAAFRRRLQQAAVAASAAERSSPPGGQ
ncbi:hypothetical protein A5753_12225 [Mycobacterium sp. 852002-51971_SCH5477799-a]|uniref:DinB family protein n=1 Tax=Mycobacterium sp. 852002-51971_SCH5477799-a TaxID=1834106 RepID=UPI0008001D0A|nr:DinB family protein [Mycobacterium sp. 852002-51971_SCH5477799-a]OBF63524.1 hypothetical protein A5753_12225 [Mycobacterium sp. 852002-51971_SCH5477799-a]